MKYKHCKKHNINSENNSELFVIKTEYKKKMVKNLVLIIIKYVYYVKESTLKNTQRKIQKK